MPEHDHEHDHDARHRHRGGLRGVLSSPFGGHSHDPTETIDHALESSEQGIKAVKISLLTLFVTACLQLAVVLVSGSVALLTDTLHNFADALTSLPLWLAFSLSRRPPNHRYTYGYGRAEDLAGIFIIGVISVSVVIAGYESVERLLDPRPIGSPGFVIAAALLGFAGNELVAAYRIRVGRRIGSASLVADGVHARTDGMTSLAVLVGAIGSLAGFELADPIVGLLITAAICFVLRSAARDIYYRLMDAVTPGLVTHVGSVAAGVDGVEEVRDVKIRWIGHALRAEVIVTVSADLDIVAAHAVGSQVHHALLHEIPRLSYAMVHTNPSGAGRHDEIAHHFPQQPD